ncbi:hypothetical protein ACIQ4I_05430 [Rummeliibacillus sp. NPDC094406]|uniref:hypothetical protein n=1 Tax=Rummeliibacillus sp. NPDC094406 TaxID=3364511 RepID=UPI00381ED5AF
MGVLGEGNSRILAELGIGTIYEARIIGRILEHEKCIKRPYCILINHTFGGTIQAVHIECLSKNYLVLKRKNQITQNKKAFKSILLE